MLCFLSFFFPRPHEFDGQGNSELHVENGALSLISAQDRKWYPQSVHFLSLLWEQKKIKKETRKKKLNFVSVVMWSIRQIYYLEVISFMTHFMYLHLKNKMHVPLFLPCLYLLSCLFLWTVFGRNWGKEILMK